MERFADALHLLDLPASRARMISSNNSSLMPSF